MLLPQPASLPPRRRALSCNQPPCISLIPPGAAFCVVAEPEGAMSLDRLEPQLDLGISTAEEQSRLRVRMEALRSESRAICDFT